MTESQAFESLGRKQAQLEDLDRNYSQLLGLFASVLRGDICPSRVMLNLTERTWAFSNPGESPQMPATINGLPVCVTGKAPGEIEVLIDPTVTPAPEEPKPQPPQAG